MKTVIVGGVAGGASAAARLRRLDESAEIVILEQDEQVSFANCGLPYYIGGMIRNRDALLVQTPGKLRLILNIDVRIRSEVVGIDVDNKTLTVKNLISDEQYLETWDKLVLCPGGIPIHPPVPGDDLPRIFTLRNIADMDCIKREMDARASRALILGGGFIGVELAENFRERGLQVDLVEKNDHILPFLDQEMANELEGHMTRNGIRLHLANSVSAYHKKATGVICELQNDVRIPVDFVVNAIGVQPATDLAVRAGIELGDTGGIKVNTRMQTSHPDIYAAGDAAEVTDLVTGEPCLIPLAGPANRQGRVVADNICGRDSTFTAVQGTSILKVFDMTAGATGATEKRLQRASIPYKKIYIHPPGHASYYPGTAAMHLKLIFSSDDGKVLGTQIVGFDGVDKRIDVLAVAIRQGLTVYDLEDMELAYAPPYGSAKDPVNMAGFVATNLLRGDAPHWYAEEFPALDEDSLIIDVRGDAEYERWHIPGAISIPHTCLRDELEDVPKGKKLYLYCRTGFRSYLGLRILKQLGYPDVATLSGGAITFGSYSSEIQTGKRLIPEISYGEEHLVELIRPSGKVVELDATHIGYASPLQLLQQNLDQLDIGDDVVVTISDAAFLSYLPSWCNTYGHVLIDIQRLATGALAQIRKGLEIG